MLIGVTGCDKEIKEIKEFKEIKDNSLISLISLNSLIAPSPLTAPRSA